MNESHDQWMERSRRWDVLMSRLCVQSPPSQKTPPVKPDLVEGPDGLMHARERCGCPGCIKQQMLADPEWKARYEAECAKWGVEPKT